jgi:urease accessory protein
LELISLRGDPAKKAPAEHSPQIAPREADNWRAEIHLGLGCDRGRTVLVSRSHSGPLTVQRPFYPEGAVCHVYLLHPPGGVVGGDELRVDVTSAPDSAALLTTPAASKFYRSGGPIARQIVNLRLANRAALEWLPQEAIVFRGARLRASLHATLAEQSRFIAWDTVCLGRPACNEGFGTGSGLFEVRIERQGRPLLLERFHASAESAGAGWGLRGMPIWSGLWACPFPRLEMPAVRSILEEREFWGCTLLGDLLVCRGIGDKMAAMRRTLVKLWEAIRPVVCGLPACPPRIWAT